MDTLISPSWKIEDVAKVKEVVLKHFNKVLLSHTQNQDEYVVMLKKKKTKSFSTFPFK